MNIYSILFLFGITFIAGIISFRLASKISNWIKYLLSFSGAYLFGLTITHLLPEMYEKTLSMPLIPLFILVGFFFQLILEQFSKGIEHGHIHHHDKSKFPVMLIVALLIHETMEGVLLNVNSSDANNYLFGLTVHKIPIAIILAILLKEYTKDIFKPILILALLAMATPIGALSSGLMNEQFVTILTALVTGGFLHISTTILFESSPNHTFNMIKFAMAIFGASISILI